MVSISLTLKGFVAIFLGKSSRNLEINLSHSPKPVSAASFLLFTEEESLKALCAIGKGLYKSEVRNGESVIVAELKCVNGPLPRNSNWPPLPVQQ